jgi:ketosteroid isomerase-like protein
MNVLRPPLSSPAGGEAQSSAGRDRNAPPWLTKFYEAYVSGDPARLDAVLDDDVTWLLAGPAERVDLFGMRRGKAAVIELITRTIPRYQTLSGFEVDQLLVQGEHVALSGRICSQQPESGRAIRFSCAHFMRFRDGKLVSMRAISDSFDALEQITGCRIAIKSDPDGVLVEPDESVSAV